MLCLKVKLSDTAHDLQEMVAAKLLIHSENVKVIANGRVLNSALTLLEQGVKNNKQIMGIYYKEIIQIVTLHFIFS